VAGPGGWRLLDGHVETRRFRTLTEAATHLAGVRLVGWIGYEALAAHAGLPSYAPGEPAAWLLVDPEPAPAAGPANGGPAGPARVSLADAAYRTAVGRVLELVAAGEAYQVNLTRRWSVAWRGGMAPLVRTVAHDAPPYLAWARGDGLELVCASMELLLERRGERVETRPIKGTRARTGDARADRAAASELDADPKERAELAMVVDLERNDLGRVARTGSVRVADPGSVHAFTTVLHRIASVTAEVEPGLPWWELLRAVAPSGSVTGAPKRAAMAAIARLEPLPRGPYTGALGVIEPDGDLTLALTIRTAWSAGGWLHLAAGCGIVWGSRADREEAESRLKVAHWLRTVEGAGELGVARRPA